jgi:glycosyltransferase involved in cell wall biosynthesis
MPLINGRVRTGFSAFVESRRLGVNFDVVEHPEWGAEGWMFAALRTKPTVAHLHTPLALLREYDERIEVDRAYRWSSYLERFAVRRADGVTSPSRLLVRTLQELGWLPKVDVEIIPYPVDWPRWNHVETSPEIPPRVLFLGRLEPRKAPELLVKALALIQKEVSQAEVLFVGANTKSGGANTKSENGPSYIDQAMKPLGDLRGCHFVDHVPRHELAHFLATSRVLAMPSWFESYGMVASEAMAAGRPVVVTSTSGVAELIEGTQAGRIVPPGDPVALADALLPFLKDSLYATKSGEKAREVVRDGQDPDKIAARREVLYAQVITSFKRKRSLFSPLYGRSNGNDTESQVI